MRDAFGDSDDRPSLMSMILIAFGATVVLGILVLAVTTGFEYANLR